MTAILEYTYPHNSFTLKSVLAISQCLKESLNLNAGGTKKNFCFYLLFTSNWKKIKRRERKQEGERERNREREREKNRAFNQIINHKQNTYICEHETGW